MTHLLVEAEGARLLGADDRAELAPEPLQFVGIGSAELVDGDLVSPTSATVEAGVARKMSPMPQIAKLTIRTPNKMVAMALPTTVCPALRMFRSIVNPFPENSLNLPIADQGLDEKGKSG